MKTSTVPPPAPTWLLIDAEEQVLGHVATAAAASLRGKNRASFSPHQLCGDHVVVINAAKLRMEPTKLHRRVYHRHTGYIGNLKTTTLGELFGKNPCLVIEKAVRGMLPANRLRAQMLKRLHVFEGAEHPHEAQKPIPLPSKHSL